MIRIQLPDLCKTCNGVAMDSKRMEASIYDIDNNLNELKEKIEGVPFILNLDEMGEQQFANALQKTVIVPASYEYITAPYAVSRTGKKASVLVCISSYGLMCRPQYAVPRQTLDSEIYNYIACDSII